MCNLGTGQKFTLRSSMGTEEKNLIKNLDVYKRRKIMTEKVLKEKTLLVD